MFTVVVKKNSNVRQSAKDEKMLIIMNRIQFYNNSFTLSLYGSSEEI